MEFEENLSEHYKRFLFALQVANLELSDAVKVTSRGIYTYRQPERNFGNKVLRTLKDKLGLSPYYIRDGFGEPLTEDAPEKIFKGYCNKQAVSLYL